MEEGGGGDLLYTDLEEEEERVIEGGGPSTPYQGEGRDVLAGEEQEEGSEGRKEESEGGRRGRVREEGEIGNEN